MSRFHRCFPWVVVTLLLGSGQAQAQPDKGQCATAYDQGQRLKLRGRLLAAREQLAVCARDPCPSSFQPECVAWLDEVNRAIPSVVPVARGTDGKDRVEVRVSVDGRPATSRLDGTSIELDPGAHVLRFELAGAAPVEERVLLAEGEKMRRVVATFDTGPPPAKPPERLERPVPWPVWVAGGVGVAALGAFAFFATSGAVDYGKLDACKCGSAADSDKQKFLAADISLAVAGAAAAAATVLYLTRPAVRVGAGIAPGAVALGLALDLK